MKDLKDDMKSELKKQKHEPKRLSPLELMQIHGGRAHKVASIDKNADAMLAVYKNRVTYTFVMNKEVASIHYDKDRQKIFFSGHNIINMKLTQKHKDELFNFIKVLADDPEGKILKSSYEATLGGLLTDNNK